MDGRTQSKGSAGDQSVVWASVIVVGMLEVVSFCMCLKAEPSSLLHKLNVQRKREDLRGIPRVWD